MSTATQYRHLETERRGAVLIVRLANESARNSLSTEMRQSLREVVREIEDDRSVRSVYLCGKGKSFCSGGDLKMLTEASAPWAVHRRFRHMKNVLPPLMLLDRPVVCGVHGHVVGGGMGFALAADVIVAAESTQLMAGFFRLGVVPDCLMLHMLPRLIGLARTRNFLFSNGTYDAQQALDLGLVAKVVKDDELEAEGLALAQSLAEGPSEIMGLAKQVLLRSFESSLDDVMLYEDLAQALAMSGAEFKEGLEALIARRKPQFLAAAESDSTSDGLPLSDT